MRRAPNARMTGAVRQIDVYTYHGGDTDCGYDFDIGESYLVYAYAAGLAAGDDSSLVTHRCTRTRSLSEAEEDLAYLRSVMSDTGARPAGMLHGTLAVLREDYSRIDPDRLTSFSPAGIPLVLAQDGRTWRATTGQDGAFMFTGLPGGQFSMQAELDGTPFWMEEEHNFSLPNARACQEVGVIIRDDGRLRTRVLTADGRPARGLQIHLMGARDDGVLTHTGKSETTDVGGWVAFAALPPGRYVLGLGLYLETAGPVTQRTPLLAASYVEATRRRGHRAPGLPDVPGATSSVPNAAESDTPSVRRMPGELVVTLGLGQHVVTEDLMLPDTTAIVPITGRVVTPAGQPVPNVEVRLVLSLDEDYESHPLTAEHVRVDADGRFQLQGVLGRRYWIAAKSVEGAVPVKLVTPVEKFLTTRELPPVTVIVTFDSR